MADLGILSLEERNNLALEVDRFSGSINNSHVKFHVKDGSFRDILYSVKSISINGETHRLSMGIVITEQKDAENILNETTAHLKSLIDNRINSIWSLDNT